MFVHGSPFENQISASRRSARHDDPLSFRPRLRACLDDADVCGAPACRERAVRPSHRVRLRIRRCRGFRRIACAPHSASSGAAMVEALCSDGHGRLVCLHADCFCRAGLGGRAFGGWLRHGSSRILPYSSAGNRSAGSVELDSHCIVYGGISFYRRSSCAVVRGAR